MWMWGMDRVKPLENLLQVSLHQSGGAGEKEMCDLVHRLHPNTSGAGPDMPASEIGRELAHGLKLEEVKEGWETSLIQMQLSGLCF